MTTIYFFDTICPCGDYMFNNSFEEKEYRRKTLYNLKELYINKKYSMFEKESNKFLEIYPDEIEIRLVRAKVFRIMNKFNEAIEDLKYILSFGYHKDSIVELYFIYYFLNMYKEAIELLPIIYENRSIKPYSVSITEQVMKKQLGIEMRVKKKANCNYIRSQIFNYSTKMAFDHIKEHMSSIDSNTSKFNKEINIEYLFNIVRNSIKNSKKANKKEVLEVHYFALTNAGYMNETVCNYIKVVVIPNTDHIISIYPDYDVDFNYVSDLECDYDKLFNKQNQNKTKTFSRIDKFNQKWNRQ